MFKKFVNWLFYQPSELERYILSKNPTNAAEFEYWAMRYTYSNNKEGIL